MMGKTNAIRLVEQGRIPYREAFYPFDESDLSGLHAAESIGLPPVSYTHLTLPTN